MTTNQFILSKLLASKNKLNKDAIALIQSFLNSKKHSAGGFIDRSGNPDPYYSVFGYTLSYVYDIKLDIDKNKSFLNTWSKENKVDLIHAVSLIRCYFLLEAISISDSFGKSGKSFAQNSFLQKIVGRRIANKIRKEHKDLLRVITSYQSSDKGFNHLEKNAEFASVYANFLVYGLFEDLYFGKEWRKDTAKSCLQLMLQNKSFVNHPKSKQGVSSTTAAGIILLDEIGHPVKGTSNWLKGQIQSHGGFLAGEDVPVADVLSTATSLFALEKVGETNSEMKTNAVNFINLHWDKSGGFFGSIADQITDVEYTFYALLTIGC